MVHDLIFGAVVLVIAILTVVGAIVAAAIVAQNWRFLVYLSATLVGLALISAACHAFWGKV